MWWQNFSKNIVGKLREVATWHIVGYAYLDFDYYLSPNRSLDLTPLAKLIYAVQMYLEKLIRVYVLFTMYSDLNFLLYNLEIKLEYMDLPILFLCVRIWVSELIAKRLDMRYHSKLYLILS